MTWYNTDTNTLPQLICIAGRSGSGKDTLAKHLIAEHGYTRVAIADGLKEAVQSLFGLTREQLWGEGRDVFIPELQSTPRELYQRFGTHCVKLKGDVWLSPWRDRIQDLLGRGERVVCTDIRTHPEFAAARELGGTLVYLTRDQAGAPGQAATHITETAFDAHASRAAFDLVLPNNRSIEALVNDALAQLGEARAPKYEKFSTRNLQHNLEPSTTATLEVIDQLDSDIEYLEGSTITKTALVKLVRKYARREWLSKLTATKRDVRFHAVHAVVAIARSAQERCAGHGGKNLDRAVTALFKQVREHRGPDRFFVHGMARQHRPEHGETWKADYQHHMHRLDPGSVSPTRCTCPNKKPKTARTRVKGPELEERLRELARQHPQRLLVLESAYDSAKEARGFEQVNRAIELLERLVGPYLHRYLTSGDARARDVFTREQFSAGESDTTCRCERTRRTRLFVEEGVRREFFAHLRIGKGRGVHASWRCYFRVDQENQRIVIAHCGRHLPLS